MYSDWNETENPIKSYDHNFIFTVNTVLLLNFIIDGLVVLFGVVKINKVCEKAGASSWYYLIVFKLDKIQLEYNII